MKGIWVAFIVAEVVLVGTLWKFWLGINDSKDLVIIGLCVILLGIAIVRLWRGK